MVQDFQEPRHVRPFFMLRKGDVEVDEGDSVLFAAAGLAQGDGIADPFDADLVDGDVAHVGGALHIRHGDGGGLNGNG